MCWLERLGGLNLLRKSMVKLIDRPDMTIDVYRGRKTTSQQQQQSVNHQKLGRTDSERVESNSPLLNLYILECLAP